MLSIYVTKDGKGVGCRFPSFVGRVRTTCAIATQSHNSESPFLESESLFSLALNRLLASTPSELAAAGSFSTGRFGDHLL